MKLKYVCSKLARWFRPALVVPFGARTVLALAIGGSGCSGDAVNARGESVVATAAEAMNSSSTCFGVPAVVTLTGTGRAVSGDTYGSSACKNGYMIDLNDYKAGNQARVAWGGSVPTTQSACEATRAIAYVWKKSNGTFIGSYQAYGAWRPGIKGVSACTPPSFALDQAISGFIGDGAADYRVGIGAYSIDAAGNWNFTRVAFATVPTVNSLSDVLSVDSGLTVTSNAAKLDTVVSTFMAEKGSYKVGVLCRELKLEQQLQGLSQQALIRAGASSTAVSSILTGLTQVYTGLCTSAGTAADLRAGTLAYINALSSVESGIVQQFPTVTGTPKFAVETMAYTLAETLGAMSSNCHVIGHDLLAYLYDGTLPSGVGADQLLLGSCRSSGTGASGVAASLGLGADFPNQTKAQARAAFQACMTDQGGNDICNDPRAQDAPAAPDGNSTGPSAPDSSPPTECWRTDLNRACTQQEIDDLNEYKAELAKQDATVTQIQIQAGGTAPATPQHNTALDVLDKVGTVVYAAAAWAYQVSEVTKALALAEAAGTVSIWGITQGVSMYVGPHVYAIMKCTDDPIRCEQATRQAMCATAGAPYQCYERGPTKYCASDFEAVGGWYETDARPGASHEITQSDRFQHCMCEFLDKGYSGLASALAFVPLGCPSPAEKRREDCLHNPQDGIDAPNPACMKELSPPRDDDAWRGLLCQRIQCDRTQVKITDEEGNCSCGLPPTDTAAGLPCRIGTTTICDGDVVDASHCTCTPDTSGSAPIGDNPLCAVKLDATSWPGSGDNFLVQTTRDLAVHQFDATRRFAMLRPNRSAVSPLIYRNSLDAVPATGTTNPAKLRVNALISALPPSGGSVDLQLYVTSFDTPAGTQPLVHDFMGQVRLSGPGTSANLTAGVPKDVDIALNQNLINRAFSGKSFRIEYTTVASSSYTRRVGIGAQSIIGTTTATPLANRAPTCPINPTPDDPIKTITGANPIWTLESTPTDLLVNFRLSSGADAVVPPRIIEYAPVVIR